MGDRASVVFENEEERGVVLCSHWGGPEFQEAAKQWAEERYGRTTESADNRISTPETRFEPRYITVLFIKECQPNAYIGVDRNDVDDSDNGCLFIRFTKNGIETRHED